MSRAFLQGDCQREDIVGARAASTVARSTTRVTTEANRWTTSAFDRKTVRLHLADHDQ
jgi:hypothetical protein